MPTDGVMSPRGPVATLEFKQCVLPLPEAEGESFSLDLTLHGGDLVMLCLEDQHHEDSVSRAACGMLAPTAGSVAFLGRDWRDLPPDLSNASRGRIGTVFRDERWLPHQSVMQSILLPLLFHTHRPFDDISREATNWARRFGLPGLPRDRPEAVSARDRLCANLVRALVLRPALIIFEHQQVAALAGLLQTVINAIRELREQGTAILWLTQDMAFGLDRSIPATRRLRHDGTLGNALEAVG